MHVSSDSNFASPASAEGILCVCVCLLLDCAACCAVLALPPLPQELDEQLYEECRQRYEQEQRLKRQKEDQRQREWQQMQHRAQKQAQVKGLPNGVVNCSNTYTPILIRSKS